MSRKHPPACAHCDKVLNDEEYAVSHLVEFHSVAEAEARDAMEAWEWPEGENRGGQEMNRNENASSIHELAAKRKEGYLESIPYRPVQWILEGFPPGFFVGYYWVGLISGIIIGVMFGGVLI